MRILDHSFGSPADDLACDEALLEMAEEGLGESLRFWESPCPFIVLGYSNRLEEEVFLEKTRADKIPVLRRASGGGSVLQAPGSLNYSLCLEIGRDKDLAGILSANRAIMERNRKAISELLGCTVRIQGATDLALGDRKFSGNSQRRKRRALLFHGTFLIDLDLSLIPRWLRMPPKQPAYRSGREHLDFVMNLSIDRKLVKESLLAAWDARGSIEPPLERIERLTKERYGLREWNELR